MASLEIVLEGYRGKPFSKEEKADLAAEKNRYYVELLKQMKPDSVSDSVRDTLHILRKRGYRLAIGSSSKNTKRILNYTALDHYFDAVSDGTNIAHSKPDPEVFEKAALYLKLTSSACAVVEDAYAGIDAAKAAGMLAIGIGPAADYARAEISIQQLSDLQLIFDDII